jgi:hypothetical protein
MYRPLETLKLRMLPADLGDSSDYDLDLAAIGSGVAAWFDRITGRELERNTAATMTVAADVESVVLKSYPIESITKVQLICGSSVTTMTDAVMSFHPTAGIVEFGSALGSHIERLAIESKGGYWCDPLDGSTLPTGATPLPDDILQAWYAQCRAVCDAEAIFRQKGAGNFADKDKREPSLRLQTLDILPSVKRVLQLHTRMP